MQIGKPYTAPLIGCFIGLLHGVRVYGWCRMSSKVTEMMLHFSFKCNFCHRGFNSISYTLHKMAWVFILTLQATCPAKNRTMGLQC